MLKAPTSVLTSTGLIGGFAAARISRHRYPGGAFAAAAGIGAVEQSRRRVGWVPAGLLAGVYAGTLVGSHPLAKKIGAWPAVFTATAVTAVAAEALEAGWPKRTDPSGS